MRIQLRYPQRGFSLLEVTLAASILAFGFSGLAALLINTVAQSALSARRTEAVLLAEGLAAQLEMARIVEPAAGGDPVPDCIEAACAPAAFASAALAAWQGRLRTALPAGAGLVCRDGTPDDGWPGDPACDGHGPPTIKVFWRGHGQEWARHVRGLEP